MQNNMQIQATKPQQMVQRNPNQQLVAQQPQPLVQQQQLQINLL
jgi:hypothetical protein